MKSKTKITTKELIKLMHSKNKNYHLYEYAEILDVFFEIIPELIINDTEVQIDRFGTFSPRYNPAFSTTDPNTGETVSYNPSKTMKFSTSSTLNAEIKRKSSPETSSKSSKSNEGEQK